MKKRIFQVLMIMLVTVLFSSLQLFVVCGAESNPCYEYYYKQLDDGEKQAYRFLLDLEPVNDEYTVSVPGFNGETLSTVFEVLRFDHPEETAWMQMVSLSSYDADTGAVTISVTMDPFYSEAERLKMETLIAEIAAGADPSWDRYTKVRYILNVFRDNMTYDDDYIFYAENGKSDLLYNQTAMGVNVGYSICEGYTRLYKAVADRIGLPCVEVGSVAHAFIHVQMEDGKWYGVDSVGGDCLLGQEHMVSYSGDVNIYELYDGFFSSGKITQPQRTEEDYHYALEEPDPGTVDLSETRRSFGEKNGRFLYSVNDDGISVTITGYTGKQQGDLVIPSRIDGYSVTAVGNSAFAHAFFDGTLVLPDSLQVIEAQAFAYCSSLRGNIVLPDSLRRIGNAAFASCSGFTGEIIFNNKLEMIEGAAFANCRKLTGGLALPDSIQSLQGNAFYYCEGLTGNVRIPKNLDSWESGYIDSCFNLSGYAVSPLNNSFSVYNSVLYSKDQKTLISCLNAYSGALVIPEGVTEIADLALYQCKSITSISFPSTLKRIGRWGCGYMMGLQKPIELPSGIEYIGVSAFSCSVLRGRLFIPDCQIEEEAFSSINVSDNSVSVDITLAEGISSLPSGCFLWAKGICRLYTPFSLNSIPDNCFDLYLGCMLDQEITIYGAPGSAMEQAVQYFQEYGYHFTFIPKVNCLQLNYDDLTMLVSGVGSRNTLQIISSGEAGISLTESMLKNAVWSSENEGVVKIDKNGKLTAVSKGTAGVSVSVNDMIGFCHITVSDTMNTLTLPSSLQTIEPEGFAGDTSAERIIIQDGAKAIGSRAFADCSGLLYIRIPNSVTSIAPDAFAGVEHGCFYCKSGSVAETFLKSNHMIYCLLADNE